MEESEGRVEIRMNLSTFFAIVRHTIDLLAFVAINLSIFVQFFLVFFFFLEAILLAFFWCIRFVFATNDRSTCLRHHLDPNARRNCTFLALILAILLGSVLVAACHYQYRFWNLTISLALKLSITISYRKILAPQKEKECRRIETVMTYLCGKSPPFFFLARSYGIKTARDVLKSYLLRKRRERRSKFWFGVLPTQLFDKGLV